MTLQQAAEAALTATPPRRGLRILVPGLDSLPIDDWMFRCDGCGIEVQADRLYEGSGVGGCETARIILAKQGWNQPGGSSEDYCHECWPAFVSGRLYGQAEIQVQMVATDGAIRSLSTTTTKEETK